jgi:hypothetical protein
MPVHSRRHRAEQFPKHAAVVRGHEQVIRERCHGNVNVLAVRIAANTKVRASCLEHKATGICYRAYVLDNRGEIAD